MQDRLRSCGRRPCRLFQRSCGWALGTALLATVAPCDEVLLRGGGRVSGMVVERNERSVVIETGPGRVTLAMSRVEKIVEGRSALETFQERAGALAASDSEGWAALARWAAERDLVTPSRNAWQRVLALNPQDAEANAALGRVALDGTWMAADDAYRSRGYVQYEGRWMTPPSTRPPCVSALRIRPPSFRPGSPAARPRGRSPCARGRGAGARRRVGRRLSGWTSRPPLRRPVWGTAGAPVGAACGPPIRSVRGLPA